MDSIVLKEDGHNKCIFINGIKLENCTSVSVDTSYETGDFFKVSIEIMTNDLKMMPLYSKEKKEKKEKKKINRFDMMDLD